MSIESFKSKETNDHNRTNSFDIDKRLIPDNTSHLSKNDEIFNIDARINQDNDSPRSKFEKLFDIDKRIGIDITPVKEKIVELRGKDVFCERTELFSTLEERIGNTPVENGTRGEWTGERGKLYEIIFRNDFSASFVQIVLSVFSEQVFLIVSYTSGRSAFIRGANLVIRGSSGGFSSMPIIAT